MVTTDLEEKEAKKFYVPIRGGNRGGRDQFKWDNVMYMPYKDRELYLGNSAMIGFLDKGGKWRKKNWYLKTEKDFKSKDPKEEMLEAKRKDEQRLKARLGDDVFDEEKEEKLEASQLSELKRKIKLHDDRVMGEGALGLGFDKLKVEIKSRPAIEGQNPYRLQGNNELDEQVPKIDNKPQKIKREQEKRRSVEKQTVEKEKLQKKEKLEKVPKDKKDKKTKKQKKSKRDRNEQDDSRRQRNRSDSLEHRSAKKREKGKDSRFRELSRERTKEGRTKYHNRSHDRKRSPSYEAGERSRSNSQHRRQSRRHNERRSRSRSRSARWQRS